MATEKELTYLDVIPEELIGEIIEHINLIENLNALKETSKYVGHSVDKYLRKFIIKTSNWYSIKNVLVLFNSLHKINYNFKIYITSSRALLIFDEGKFYVSRSEDDIHYLGGINPNEMLSIEIHTSNKNLEYISTTGINRGESLNGFKRITNVNKDFVNFCLDVDFGDVKLNDLIKTVIHSNLMSRGNALRLIKIYLKKINPKILRLTDPIFLTYFGKYLKLPIRKWTDISAGLLNKLFKIDQDNFDNFDIPIWNDAISEKYNQLTELLEQIEEKNRKREEPTGNH